MKKQLKQLKLATQEQLNSAIEAYGLYERRQNCKEWPEGSFDKHKRWYPSKKEDCGVTDSIRSPSHKFPFSYLHACKSLEHCEQLMVAEHELTLAVKYLSKKWDIKAFEPDFKQEFEKNFLLNSLPEAQNSNSKKPRI